MLFSSPMIGCAIFVSSALFVASHPSPQSSSGQSSMNSMGGSGSTSGTSYKTTGHNGIAGHTDGDEIHDGMSHGSDGAHYSPGTTGHSSTNLAATDSGHSTSTEGAHGSAHHSDAHLSIPIGGWVILSGFTGLLTLVL
ncbi:secreted protein [Melampsora americana]|nr:secreted protein [Melampsora americana]